MTLRETIARGIDPDAFDPAFEAASPRNTLLQRSAAYSKADAALEAIRAAGPTEAQIEAGARVIAPHLWDEDFLPKLRAVSADDNFAGSGLDIVETMRLHERNRARACLTAALAAKET